MSFYVYVGRLAMTSKILEATLVSPTSHKERKLTDSLAAYRTTIQRTVEESASSQDQVETLAGAGSDDLLTGSLTTLASDSNQILSEQSDTEECPIVLNDPLVVLDSEDKREHIFCWQVPHEDPFWIPLQTNELQEDLWHGLEDGDYRATTLTLQHHSSNWVLTVHIEDAPSDEEAPSATEVNPYEEYWTTDDASRKPIGVDIGETALVAGCALSESEPVDPVLFDGRRAKHLRKEMYTTLHRLDERDAADWRITERFNTFRNKLDDIIEKASREVVDYAERFTKPVIVMEDLDVGGEQLREAMFEHRRLNMWSFNRLQHRISEKANAAGIPVAFVSPEYSSQTCHQCNQIGERDGSFECQNETCWVSTYQSDINAAAVLAKRYNPWGETCSLKPDGDDSPRDGSSRDGTMEPRDRGKSSNHTSRTSSRTSPAGHWLPETDAGVSST